MSRRSAFAGGPGFNGSTHVVGGDPHLCEAAAVDGRLDHPVDERPARERLDVLLGDGHGAAARGDHRDDTRLAGRHPCGDSREMPRQRESVLSTQRFERAEFFV